jgi:hypothetical protein
MKKFKRKRFKIRNKLKYKDNKMERKCRNKN